MTQAAVVLVVDDERAHRLMLRAHLEDAGYEVLEAGDGLEALEKAEAQPVDLVLMDLVMPRLDGLGALGRLKADHPGLPVMMITAHGSIRNAVDALQAGADDYLTKPVDADEVLIKVQRLLNTARLTRQVETQAERLGERFDFSALIGESQPMLKLKETLSLVAPTQATVLITGESGTGKEVAAQVIHQNSPRSAEALVKVNCAALPETLLESELFGHEKGAYTGAAARREGRLATADRGTLFLDEIGEMSLATQAKVLRAIQEGEYTPLGSDRTLHADIRLIAATNRDLKEAVSRREFREDLYYRLNVVNVEMPPLRERGQDILTLAEHFLQKFQQEHGRRLEGFSAAARRAMLAHGWPGNVRELINGVERAVIMCRGQVIEPADLLLNQDEDDKSGGGELRAGISIREAERMLIEKTLQATDGNRTQAAQMLGVTRKTLQNKIKEFGLN